MLCVCRSSHGSKKPRRSLCGTERQSALPQQDLQPPKYRQHRLGACRVELPIPLRQHRPSTVHCPALTAPISDSDYPGHLGCASPHPMHQARPLPQIVSNHPCHHEFGSKTWRSAARRISEQTCLHFLALRSCLQRLRCCQPTAADAPKASRPRCPRAAWPERTPLRWSAMPQHVHSQAASEAKRHRHLHWRCYPDPPCHLSPWCSPSMSTWTQAPAIAYAMLVLVGRSRRQQSRGC
mmetsp:Transcript_107317/g.195214  ORF Transcript_107317/g.195214 Transcript_107317/m.195214 type:complete len:237 (-) Transcript_107317:840-1550(-)